MNKLILICILLVMFRGCGVEYNHCDKINDKYTEQYKSAVWNGKFTYIRDKTRYVLDGDEGKYSVDIKQYEGAVVGEPWCGQGRELARQR